MEFPCSVEKFEQVENLVGELHLAIGVFDGVHLGHKAVIESAIFSALRSGGTSGVLTFDPHPSRLFRPDDATRLLMGVSAKISMLHGVGVDLVICKHFDREFAAISAESFLAHLKAQLPALRSVYVGENFRFGKMRAGDVDLMVQSGRQLGVAVFSADRIKHNGEPISSTRIRKVLEAGKIEEVNDLLGYTYFAEGTIVDGAKLGRTIGFPTLNLPWVPECLPRFGVYQVRFRSKDCGSWVPGVANYGVRPTVDAEAKPPVLEVHALSETNLTFGDQIAVEWLHFIRPEQKFESVEALVAQIAIDKKKALELIDNG